MKRQCESVGRFLDINNNSCSAVAAFHTRRERTVCRRAPIAESVAWLNERTNSDAVSDGLHREWRELCLLQQHVRRQNFYLEW